MKTCEEPLWMLGFEVRKVEPQPCGRIARFEIQVMDPRSPGPVVSAFYCRLHLGGLVKDSTIGWQVWFIKRIQNEDK